MSIPADPEGETVAWTPAPSVGLLGGRGRLLGLGIAVLVVLWLARGIVGPFVVAAVLAYAFSPVVSAVEEKTHAPRVLVIGAGYVVVLGLIAVAAMIAAERAGSEIQYLSSGGPDVIATALGKVFGDRIVFAGMTFDVKDVAAQIRSSLLGTVQTPSGAFHLAEQAVEVALQTILALIVTFYFLLDGRRFGLFALRFLDRSQRADALRIAHRIHVVLGRWLRGQLLLIGLVAVVLYVILGPILHVPYALALSILSGVLEIIPLVGPIIAAALAGTVAFATRGTDTTIAVLAAYLLVRQIEDQIVMPLVIGRVVHLHPVVTIFAVLVGLSAWGVLGGLLGVPVAAALNVTLHELYPDETRPGADVPGGRGRIEGGVGTRLRRGIRRADAGQEAGPPATGPRESSPREAGLPEAGQPVPLGPGSESGG
ncbi:MAG: AI-2E family transporter [Candidatus Limnocylindrales bacterium]|jgi:predicted PurR-regulated permease PerM